MTKKRKLGRYTPPGTQDPNAKRKVVISSSKSSLDSFARAVGMPSLKAAPRSGWCVSCGRELIKPPVGRDRDHSVCDDCFPDDMREEWEGRSVDHTEIDLAAGTIREIPAPPEMS